jgi:diguanylate cyclase (GGDEF)-like protein
MEDHFVRLLLDDSPVISAILDPDGRVVASNWLYDEALALDRSPIGQVAWELPRMREVPGLADRFADVFWLAVAVGNRLPTVPFHIDFGPTDVWIGAMQPLVAEQDEVVAFLTEWTNIVFQTGSAGPANVRRTRFLDDASIASPAPMVVADRGGQIREANPAWFTVVGPAVVDVLDLGMIGSLPADARASFARGFDHVVSGMLPWFEAVWTPICGDIAPPAATYRWSRLDDGPRGDAPWLLGIGRDLATSGATLTELRAGADRDHLTGLANRRAFDASLADAVARIGVDHDAIVLLILDVDGLKTANDAFGHAAGDALLLAVARRLTRWRTTGLFARFGGDELAGWVPVAVGSHDPDALVAAILAAVEHPVADAPHLGTVRISVGTSAITDPRADLDAAFDVADRAMYAAKSRRRAGEQ